MSMQKHVIIVAGGTGTRMLSDVPKQFLKLAGKPVMVYAIERFLEYDPDIRVIIVSHKDHLKETENIIKAYFSGPVKIVAGGDLRFDSVKNGLEEVQDGLVAIHDAARPMVNVNTIKNCFEAAEAKGNGIPVVSLNESLRFVDGENNKAVNRTQYKIVQTPQCFKTELIKKAFEQNYSNTFTDDASVLEKAGGKINLVEGNAENIKITTPHDLVLAQVLLK